MKLLDLTLATPAGNLACDEALLNSAEAGHGGEILRFWEPQECFVVVGYANKVETEVKAAACAAKNVPIFRRCSGGGTVLQGPGCLNYTLILQIAKQPPLTGISGANQFIMERNRSAIESEVRSRTPDAGIAIQGHTDLTLGTRHPSPATPRKFSGNAQRRHQRFLLFHGTFLLNFELPRINELLRMPSRQPDYRNCRGHADFLVNLNLPAARLKDALSRVWKVTERSRDFPEPETQKLAAEKYSTIGWTFKF
jgi:lipoate-protein ligase A